MSKYRLAAFDLDGTLVDSAPDLAHCLGQALDSVGLAPPGLAAATGWIGDGVEALVRRGLTAALGFAPDDDTMTAALRAFDRCYRANLFTASRLYPDVQQTLAALRQAGITLGCVTNKLQRYAEALLEQAGIAGELRFIYGGDRFERKKPDPLALLSAAGHYRIDPAEAVMIGDSINDLKAAEGAGFGFVFAAFGYTGAADAAPFQGNPAIERFGDLSKLLCG